MKQRLETVEAVIRVLYGYPAAMAEELGYSRSVIWKYQQRDMFSGELYEAIQSKAALSGYEVADDLFTPVTVHPRLVNRS